MLTDDSDNEDELLLCADAADDDTAVERLADEVTSDSSAATVAAVGAAAAVVAAEIPLSPSCVVVVRCCSTLLLLLLLSLSLSLANIASVAGRGARLLLLPPYPSDEPSDAMVMVDEDSGENAESTSSDANFISADFVSWNDGEETAAAATASSLEMPRRPVSGTVASNEAIQRK
ncbi:hypothetical protein H4R26_005471 [Coemansia thaxteri]|uniref:Uncharacterized protein n=1 Tax=Coemansia thaxteri TaxID=2663907 RepID=A0A9W8B963_9FUNG|nr:hypothetical protein H4R26_005471 [Coemansia thaxteri]